ncbi:MAG: hypothetical protein KC910_37265, partial [Candidatus Eremiobacteraeota bacterium]|nr:hypothetical protein [Candidatus Eremiobacteraeota bacterium]
MVESRLQAGRDLQSKPKAVSLLEQALQEQQVDFEATIDGRGQDLADATFQIWLIGDQNGDGRVDIAITQRSNLDPLKEVGMEVTDLRHTGKAPESFLGKRINQAVGERFVEGVREAVPQVTQQLRQIAMSELTEALADGNVLLNEVSNEALEVAYELAEEGVLIPTQSQLFPSLPMGLTDARLLPSGEAMVSLHSNGSNGVSRAPNLAQNHRTPAGQLSVTLQGELINLQLRDRSVGGNVDWNQFLGGLRGGRLKQVHFGRDRAGNTVYPKLISHKGGVAVKFDIVARFKGVIPLPGDLLGSKLHTGVVIPLRISHEGHNLHVKPDGRRVEFTNPDSQEPLDLVDLVPTRWLTGAVPNFLGQILGRADIAAQADNVA